MSEWISVDDDRESTPLECVLQINTVGGMWVEQYWDNFDENVTHWQPLPEPPI